MSYKTIGVIRGACEIEALFLRLAPLGAMFCGGYVRYMCSPSLNPVDAGDIDIYSQDDDSFERIKKCVADEGLEIKHENEISVTYSRTTDGVFAYTPTVQLIKPKIEGAIVAKGDQKTILDNFDFTIVRIGLVDLKTALADADFEDDEVKKLLRIKNIHCPISSMLRCMKYSRKGYFLKPVEALKLFNDWEGRDSDYREKLFNFLEKSKEQDGLTKEEIEELEAMLWVD